MVLFSYFAHRRACHDKQNERRAAIQQLDPRFHEPITPTDTAILSQPIARLIENVHSGELTPLTVLTAYTKKALAAHAQTNCLSEILVKSAQGWANSSKFNAENLKEKRNLESLPLAGVPVSLKDTVGVEGYDSCIGYSAWVGKPFPRHSALVRLLLDAGAVPFVKTTIPITLLSFESTSDVFGVTTNPYNKGYSPGGSSGGEAALLAYGGSRIGVGTDVAGSVRVPAHYCGVYSIRSSAQRFLKAGNATSMPGQEGVLPVYSPMARTLEDLDTFWQAVMSMKPWKYDPSVLPIPWRKPDFEGRTALKWAVIWDDGVVRPSPACHRALKTVVDVLQRNGDSIVAINDPALFGTGLNLAAQLLLADGGKVATKPIRFGEFNDPGMVQAMRMFSLPRALRILYSWIVRYIYRDPLYADLIAGWHEKPMTEYMNLVAQREEYRLKWFEMWNGSGGDAEKGGDGGWDFILTVPNALPAVPHGGMKDGWKSCGYTFLWNLLDYSAGVMPITHVNSVLDRLAPRFAARNAIEKGAYTAYDPVSMSGLPVGVQVVGRRLEEEKVMEGMKIIEGLLAKEGIPYEGIKI
ncbi:amidase family protein [Pleurotus pulmonarius]